MFEASVEQAIEESNKFAEIRLLTKFFLCIKYSSFNLETRLTVTYT